MSKVQAQAELAASRVDESEVGLDPIQIITIITDVLPKLIQCFRRNDEPDEDEVKAAVKLANDRNSRQLHRRTTTAVMREKRNLSRSQASAIADAIIEQCLESPSHSVASCCAEAGE